MQPEPAPAWFVTGTDTGVGKTLVSAALLHALARLHPRVVGMKPIAAGLVERNGVAISDDVRALRAASTLAVTAALDNPVALPEPMSPHLAARRAGQTIEIAKLAAACAALRARADAVVVEGAGGWRVPINDRQTIADLARALEIPVVLVVGVRLGCLNHALLTAEAIAADRVRLAGWVANVVDPGFEPVDDNVATLRARLPAPLLATIRWQANPDPRTIAIDLPP